MNSALTYVEVSPEMTMALGPGPLLDVPVPAHSMALYFCWGDPVNAASVSICPEFDATFLSSSSGSHLTLIICRAAFLRLGGVPPADSSTQQFHLPSSLLSIAVAVRDCGMSGETQTVYRLGKSIELLCELLRLQSLGQLVPLCLDETLSLSDTRRVFAARRMIDEKWNEKLTLSSIARACGFNRAKLTSSFRAMFNCSVTEALSSKRLEEAQRMLLTTDLSVASVGYKSGYMNNASFSRAFSRRYGRAPSDCRSSAAVAL